MDKNSYKILLIDDHPLILSGIISEIQKLSDFEKIETASTLSEARRKISTENFDIIIVDLSLPDGNGLDFLKSERNKNKEIKLSILTMHRDWNFLDEARRLSLNGFLIKDQSSVAIASSIIKILNNENIFPEHVPVLIQNDSEGTKDHQDKFESLSEREKEVLSLLIEGFLNKEIAEKLNISIRTVEAHRSNLMKKLQTKNSIELGKFREYLIP
ncbi:MAG: response regulator transcription factor [Spirochaetia bacterium]|nr:response regulator transcription factor [Spirochaetia bacterium]